MLPVLVVVSSFLQFWRFFQTWIFWMCLVLFCAACVEVLSLFVTSPRDDFQKGTFANINIQPEKEEKNLSHCNQFFDQQIFTFMTQQFLKLLESFLPHQAKPKNMLDPFAPQRHREGVLPDFPSLQIPVYNPTPLPPFLCYANGVPIIKANDVTNDKPTGRWGPWGVKSPRGAALIWMPWWQNTAASEGAR